MGIEGGKSTPTDAKTCAQFIGTSNTRAILPQFSAASPHSQSSRTAQFFRFPRPTRLPPTSTSPARAISIRHQAQQSFFNQRHPTTRSVPLQFPIHLGVGEDTLTSRPSLDVDPIFLRPWQEPSSSCPILSGRSPLNRRPTDPPASGQHTLGCMACSWI